MKKSDKILAVAVGICAIMTFLVLGFFIADFFRSIPKQTTETEEQIEKEVKKEFEQLSKDIRWMGAQIKKLNSENQKCKQLLSEGEQCKRQLRRYKDALHTMRVQRDLAIKNF